MTTTTSWSFDTNGGANRFFIQNGELYVSGHSIAGSYKLSGADNSSFLAKLWGGTVLSNGNVGNNTGGNNAVEGFKLNPNQITVSAATGSDLNKNIDVFAGNLNQTTGTSAAKDVGDKQTKFVVNFGNTHVGGSEKIGFATQKEADNFLAFVRAMNEAGVLDNIM